MASSAPIHTPATQFTPRLKMRINIALYLAQGVTGAITGWLVNIPTMVWTLVAFMAMDLFMGFLVAKNNNDVCSKEMYAGLRKKLGVLIMVAAAHLVKDAAHIDFDLGSAAAGAYCLWEFVSIAENSVKLGAPMPEVLANIFRAAKEGRRSSNSEQ